MRARIHGGACDIGGTCIEIESAGRRLIVDLGLPMSAGLCEDLEALVPSARELRENAADLSGLIVTHPYRDQYGMINGLRPDVPVLIGADARRIFEVATRFTPSSSRLDNVIEFRDRQPVELGPFVVTPYLVENTPNDRYGMLIEADGRRLFYSGDVRGAGRNSDLFERFLRNSPEGVGVLLVEDITLGCVDNATDPLGERALQAQFEHLFEDTQGLALVWTSPQNVDRLATVYRACQRSGRQLIIDFYTAEILRAARNPDIPQGLWDGVKVFLPASQRRLVQRKKLFTQVEAYRPNRIFGEFLAADAHKSVLLFRPSVMRDLEWAGCLDGARLIFSLWKGYLKDRRSEPLLDWIVRHGISMDIVHTNGYASPLDLARLARAMNPISLVPIHADSPDRYRNLFDRIEVKAEGEWWSV